jgi:hypothetical protein
MVPPIFNANKPPPHCNDCHKPMDPRRDRTFLRWKVRCAPCSTQIHSRKRPTDPILPPPAKRRTLADITNVANNGVQPHIPPSSPTVPLCRHCSMPLDRANDTFKGNGRWKGSCQKCRQSRSKVNVPDISPPLNLSPLSSLLRDIPTRQTPQRSLHYEQPHIPPSSPTVPLCRRCSMPLDQANDTFKGNGRWKGSCQKCRQSRSKVNVPDISPPLNLSPLSSLLPHSYTTDASTFSPLQNPWPIWQPL